MHKSRVVLLCMALVLTLALLIPLVGCGGGSEAVPCKVSSVSGDVQVLKSGSTASVKATNGMELAVGDTITTGANGSAKLTFFDGSVMEIKANSKIVVNELSTASTGSTSVSLKETVGSTVNRVAKLVDSSSKYEVDTPAASAVVRGTVFDMLVQQNGDSTVKAEQDSVDFTASGQTVTVNAGFQSTAMVGGKPSTPSAISTTPTPTATSTSTSGKTLGDVLGTGKSIGDVKFDQVMTTSGQTQSTTMHMYVKDAWLSDKMKFRYEIAEGGTTMVMLYDFAARTAYEYFPAQNMAYRIDYGQAEQSDPTKNADNIIPVKVGTETIDSKLCDVYQWTYQGATGKEWIWREKSFPVRMESTTSSGTTIIEYRNIVFGTLSDSLFQLPAGVTITQFPSYSPGT